MSLAAPSWRRRPCRCTLRHAGQASAFGSAAIFGLVAALPAGLLAAQGCADCLPVLTRPHSEIFSWQIYGCAWLLLLLCLAAIWGRMLRSGASCGRVAMSCSGSFQFCLQVQDSYSSPHNLLHT